MRLSEHLADDAQSGVRVEVMVVEVTDSEGVPVDGLKEAVSWDRGEMQEEKEESELRPRRKEEQVVEMPEGMRAVEMMVLVAAAAEEVAEADYVGLIYRQIQYLLVSGDNQNMYGIYRKIPHQQNLLLTSCPRTPCPPIKTPATTTPTFKFNPLNFILLSIISFLSFLVEVYVYTRVPILEV